MKNMLLLAAFASFLLVLAACGSDKSDQAAMGAANDSAAKEQVEIKATSYKFDKKEYKIKKGVPTKLTLTSQSGVHGAQISKLNVKLEDGDSTVITVNDAGTYNIHCFIPCGSGHTDMQATLVVE